MNTAIIKSQNNGTTLVIPHLQKQPFSCSKIRKSAQSATQMYTTRYTDDTN